MANAHSAANFIVVHTFDMQLGPHAKSRFPSRQWVESIAYTEKTWKLDRNGCGRLSFIVMGTRRPFIPKELTPTSEFQAKVSGARFMGEEDLIVGQGEKQKIPQVTLDFFARIIVVALGEEEVRHSFLLSVGVLH
jgi:hypothetical protein